MEQQRGDQGEDSATILVTGEGGMDQGGGRGGGRKWSDLTLILNGGLTRHARASELRGAGRGRRMPPWSSARTAVYHDGENLWTDRCGGSHIGSSVLGSGDMYGTSNRCQAGSLTYESGFRGESRLGRMTKVV